MTVRERIRDWLAGTDIEERAITPNQLFNTGQWDEYDFLASSGQAVTASTAMEAAVGACVRLLADDISSLPLDAFTRSGPATVPVDAPAWAESPSGRRFDTSISYVSDWITSIGLDGNAFTLATPNTIEPETLEVLDPKRVDVISEGGRVRWRVDGNVYDESRIMHVPWVRLPGAVRGIDPVHAAKDSVGLELAARKWAGAFFREGGTLGGIVRVPGDLTPEQVNTLREQFEAKHRGERNWWKPGVLTGGAEYDDTALKPGEASLEPLWRHILEEACRVFHIPPHLLASQDPGGAARASVEERGIGYVRHAVRPFVSRFEAAHSRLLPEGFVKLNLNALMRGDAKTRAEFYSVLLQNKVIRREEVRDLEDLDWDGELGYLETPNNNPPEDEPVAVAPERAEPMSLTVNDGPINVNAAPMSVHAAPTSIQSELRLDSVQIGDEAARQMAEASSDGFAAAATVMLEATVEDRERIVGAFEEQGMIATTKFLESNAELRAEVAELKRQREVDIAPVSFDIRRDEKGTPREVFKVQGERVTKQTINHDESGRIIGISAEVSA